VKEDTEKVHITSENRPLFRSACLHIYQILDRDLEMLFIEEFYKNLNACTGQRRTPIQELQALPVTHTVAAMYIIKIRLQFSIQPCCYVHKTRSWF
jgi:hypothetical protein